MSTPPTPRDELLTIDEALKLVDLPHSQLLAAIERQALPVVRGTAYQGGRLVRTLHVRRADLERFAGSQFHEAVRFVDSLCSAKGCYRYGPTCEHGGTWEPLSRGLSDEEVTAYHEAGHATVAVELGWKLLEVSIVRDATSNGRYRAVPRNDLHTLDGLRADLTVRVAGPLAADMARRRDVGKDRDARLRVYRGSEESPLELQLAAGEILGLDTYGAIAWVDEATGEAADRAYEILESGWVNVEYLATRLLEHRTVRYDHDVGPR